MRDFKALTEEQKLDLLADIIDPAVKILADDSVRKAYNDGRGKTLDIFKAALKADREAVIELLAAFDGVPATEYKLNLLDPIAVFAEIITNPELVSVFGFAGLTGGAKSSGSQSENTTVKEA